MLTDMTWLSKHPKVKRVLMVLLFLCLLPLAPEMLVLLDVVGLEATLVFFFLYSNQLVQEFTSRLSYAYYVVEARVSKMQQFAPVERFGFGISVVASFATLFVTGSLTLALFTWGPVLLAAS